MTFRFARILSAFARQGQNNFVKCRQPSALAPVRHTTTGSAPRFLLCGGGTTALIAGLFGAEDGDDKDDKDEEESEAQNKLIDIIKMGVLAQMQGNYDKAENMLHIALKMAQDIDNYDGITYCYDQLANVAFERGDYMKCERLFKHVIIRILSTRTVQQDDNKIIEMALKLAKIYGSWGDDEKASSGYKFCIETQEKKLRDGQTDEDTTALWGMSRDWYAHYLLDKHRYTEALQEFKSAQETCQKLFGESHHQSIVLLNSIGTVHSLMDNQQTAIAYFQRATTLARTSDDENYPAYLVNLGMARVKQGRISEAMSSCKEGKRVGKAYNAEEVVAEAEECLKAATDAGKAKKEQQ